MNQVEFYGFCKMPNNRVNALSVALSVIADDFTYDDKRNVDFDVSVNDGFEEAFPEAMPGRVLSGLWQALYGAKPYGAVEYLEPNAKVSHRPFGALIASGRGTVEAAAEIIKRVVRDDDEAVLWWASLDCGEPAQHGSIRIHAGGSEYDQLESLMEQLAADTPNRIAATRRIVEDRLLMFDALSAVAA